MRPPVQQDAAGRGSSSIDDVPSAATGSNAVRRCGAARGMASDLARRLDRRGSRCSSQATTWPNTRELSRPPRNRPVMEWV